VVVEHVQDFGTAYPAETVELVKLNGPARIRTLPDFASFGDRPTREKTLKVEFPLA
jgi:hypothetical protein